MIDYRAVLRLNLVSGKWLYTIVFTNAYIQVSNTFTIIELIAESTLRLIDDARGKIFGNSIFEKGVVT